MNHKYKLLFVTILLFCSCIKKAVLLHRDEEFSFIMQSVVVGSNFNIKNTDSLYVIRNSPGSLVMKVGVSKDNFVNQTLMDDLILTSNLGEKSLSINKKEFVNKVFSTQYSLFFKDSITNLPKHNYRKFLPIFNEYPSSCMWYSTNYNYPFASSLREDENNLCNSDIEFIVKTDRFPNKFHFPRDLIDSYNCSSGKMTKTQYLIWDIPLLVKINSIKQNTLGFEKTDSSKWLIFNKRRLMFNPGFAAYEESIKMLWNLYLINLKYSTLSNTLIVNDRIDSDGKRFMLNLYSKNVTDHIKSNFPDLRKMYEAYFELILWQIYLPSDFNIKDNRGKHRSFTFTSNNNDYPGNYEVKFNIYTPFIFRVFKR